MFLELISRGSIISPDNAAELYTLVMGAYAGAGEIKGWLQKPSADNPTEAADPWLERAQKGGLFVGFWLILYAAAYLLRLEDGSYPMPHELKSITMQMVSIFFVAYTLRNARRTIRARKMGSQEGMEQESTTTEPGWADKVLEFLRSKSESASMTDLEKQFPDVSRRSLNRLMSGLISDGRILRIGQPKSPDVRYKAS